MQFGRPVRMFVFVLMWVCAYVCMSVCMRTRLCRCIYVTVYSLRASMCANLGLRGCSVMRAGQGVSPHVAATCGTLV